MIKVIIIEDEQPAINLIKNYLKDFTKIEVIAECLDFDSKTFYLLCIPLK